MQSTASRVVILGTGGTIAGSAADASDNVGYRAGEIGVDRLAAAVPALAGLPLEFEQVAQIDSKDMTHAVWQRLARRCAAQLTRTEVAGLVITHGTDTLEETAWFLQRVLVPSRPVVLTAAMRPATALFPDGPQNLLDAVGVARTAGAQGVVAVLAGAVHAAQDVRKQHSYRVDAFDSGDAGPIARIEEGRLRRWREWPVSDVPPVAAALAVDAAGWPVVEIVASHAGARGATVDAIVAAGCRGVVVAGTGNGTVHAELEAALRRAQGAGVTVWRSTRCAYGVVVEGGEAAFEATPLSPPKARVELMLRLLDAAGGG